MNWIEIEITTTLNSTYKKQVVQCLNEAFPQVRDKAFFVSSSVLTDSFRLRNRQLLKTTNRQIVS